jgi:RNA polymerase sigma-70 factor (ECF subfamily)
VDDLDDRDLMQRVARRDAEALRALYRRHSGHVHALARRVLRDPDDAKSVVQDTFVRAWDAAARYNPELASARTWLLTIAHRLALNVLRDRPPEAVPLEDWDGPTRTHPGSAEAMDGLYLSGLLATLPAPDRALIDLAYYRGHSHSEIALITGWPLGTVKTRLRAALSQLRARMETA